MAMQESGEMYLESILVLSEGKKAVRSIDVAEYLGVSKPAVSRAVSRLKNEGYILIDGDGALALTEKGADISGKIYERHRVLTSFLMSIGVKEETASKDACKMEHDISDETFEAIKRKITNR